MTTIDLHVRERNRQTARAVLAESDNIRALHNLSAASASGMATIRRVLLAYAQSVIRDGRPGTARHEGLPGTEAALAPSPEQVPEPRITVEAGSAVHGALLARAMQVGSARHDRLLPGNDRPDETKWAAVIVLALSALLATGAIHLERARAFLLPPAIFTTAASVTLGSVALRGQPFTGRRFILPSALRTWPAGPGQPAP